MVANLVFLVLIVVALVRTVSYGIYCVKRSLVGGISVFVLALGIILCGITIWITGIK